MRRRIRRPGLPLSAERRAFWVVVGAFWSVGVVLHPAMGDLRREKQAGVAGPDARPVAAVRF
jgi:hypothetical protein